MNAIETHSLRKVYPAPAIKRRRGVPAPAMPPSAEIVAIDSLDLAVAEGEFFGVLGPNGAGKTTLIGILTTRVRITTGEAF
ncbi:MAG TPA: ATP-binding cassette domain-containing protein, partial [Thermoanaerobaculia bacterium]|nr:ATP-binding cassette domain-containing protein [Thermoanaerobaculia bacterium]